MRRVTMEDRDGFYCRIYKRHVTGSEERSHKFSHAYNTGRIWRDKRDRGTGAMTAKSLRRLFVRRHCRATFLIVPPEHLGGLPASDTVSG